MTESSEVQLARFDERLKNLERDQAETARDAAEARKAVAGLGRDDMSRLARLIEFFDEIQLRKIHRIVEVFDAQVSDKQEFSRSLRISIISMVASVLVFAVMVPLLQHYLVR